MKTKEIRGLTKEEIDRISGGVISSLRDDPGNPWQNYQTDIQ